MLNAGCFFAVAFWICVLLRSQQQPARHLFARPHLWLAAIAAIAISIAAFKSTLWNPFQFDAFTHLFEVRDAALPTILARFSRGTGETLFFRPVGWLAYWIDAHGSGTDLLRWHLVNILLHAGNGLLVYLLLLRLDLQRFPSAFGALAFDERYNRGTRSLDRCSVRSAGHAFPSACDSGAAALDAVRTLDPSDCRLRAGGRCVLHQGICVSALPCSSAQLPCRSPARNVSAHGRQRVLWRPVVLWYSHTAGGRWAGSADTGSRHPLCFMCRNYCSFVCGPSFCFRSIGQSMFRRSYCSSIAPR
jgi:hypothetical protein